MTNQPLDDSTPLGYKIYLRIKQDMVDRSAADLHTILNAHVTDIQHILAFKTLADLLEDTTTSRTFTAPDGTFGFTEPLVNRLMHLAYIKGCKDIEERSFRRGFREASLAAHKALSDAGLDAPEQD